MHQLHVFYLFINSINTTLQSWGFLIIAFIMVSDSMYLFLFCKQQYTINSPRKGQWCYGSVLKCSIGISTKTMNQFEEDTETEHALLWHIAHRGCPGKKFATQKCSKKFVTKNCILTWNYDKCNFLVVC